MIKFFMVLGFFSFWITNSVQSQSLTLNEKALVVGEEITYKIFYNWKFVWVPAGEVTFTIEESINEFIVEVVGISYPSYDSFFKVRDFYTSRISKNSMLPTNFCRFIEEGSYIRYDSMSFIMPDKQLHEYFGETKETAEKFVFDLEDNVLDMVSAIYFLRGLSFSSLKENTDIPFKIFFDKELLELNIHFKGKQRRKIKNMGKIDLWHMQADLIGGNIFNKGDVMDIWVSDDGNNIPLQIESPIRFGSVKAVLKSVKGSKFDFDYNVESN